MSAVDGASTFRGFLAPGADFALPLRCPRLRPSTPRSTWDARGSGRDWSKNALAAACTELPHRLKRSQSSWSEATPAPTRVRSCFNFDAMRKILEFPRNAAMPDWMME